MRSLLLAAALALFAGSALGQTPVLTVTPSVTSGNGSLSTRLTWSTAPAAASCVASGHTSWTGAKPSSGAADLPPITMSGTYNLTLVCTWPGDTTATVKWTAPTTNTDGTALAKCPTADTTGACLAYFNVYRRVGSADVSTGEVTPVRDPNAVLLAKPNLVTGVHYFGVEAVNGNGVPSVLSNVGSKTITATATRTESVTVTVNPKPSAAVITSVE